MTTCPICDQPVEHERIEGSEGDADRPGGSAEPTASFYLDELCSVEADVQWDRICTAAAVDEETDRPVLVVYYHFFEETDE